MTYSTYGLDFRRTRTNTGRSFTLNKAGALPALITKLENEYGLEAAVEEDTILFSEPKYVDNSGQVKYARISILKEAQCIRVYLFVEEGEGAGKTQDLKDKYSSRKRSNSKDYEYSVSVVSQLSIPFAEILYYEVQGGSV